MPIKPGKPVLPGDVSETRSAADGVEAGDAVMINADGDMAAADTEAGELAGVARHDGDNEGRGNALHIEGAIVAAVADGVSEGERLGAGNATGGTTGVLAASGGGPALALSDEGGTWHGNEDLNTYDVPAGYAVVDL